MGDVHGVLTSLASMLDVGGKIIRPQQGVQLGHLAIVMVVVAARGWQSGPGDWASVVTVGMDSSYTLGGDQGGGGIGVNGSRCGWWPWWWV